VAWTSAGASPPRSRASTQPRWKWSRPVDLGGGSANQSSASSRASSASSTRPLAAKAPSRSYAWPRWRRHQASISALAGPVSKPRTGPVAGSRVRLAMPPRLSTARSSPATCSRAACRPGSSGAPWPPAATSRRRRSATTVIPVRSAMVEGSPSCSVYGTSPQGRWRRVWPCEPIARTSAARVPLSASAAFAAAAKARPMLTSSSATASRVRAASWPPALVPEIRPRKRSDMARFYGHGRGRHARAVPGRTAATGSPAAADRASALAALAGARGGDALVLVRRHAGVEHLLHLADARERGRGLGLEAGQRGPGERLGRRHGVLQRVAVHPVDAELVVQVRAGGQAGRAHVADHLALGNAVAAPELGRARHVRVQRGVALAVVEHHGVAVAALPADRHHP